MSLVSGDGRCRVYLEGRRAEFSLLGAACGVPGCGWPIHALKPRPRTTEQVLRVQGYRSLQSDSYRSLLIDSSATTAYQRTTNTSCKRARDHHFPLLWSELISWYTKTNTNKKNLANAKEHVWMACTIASPAFVGCTSCIMVLKNASWTGFTSSNVSQGTFVTRQVLPKKIKNRATFKCGLCYVVRTISVFLVDVVTQMSSAAE